MAYRNQGRIHVYLSKEELDRLNHYCQQTGLTRSGLIQKWIADKEPRERPGDDFFKAIDELFYIGININQIAVRGNASGVITEKDLVETKRYVEKLQRLRDDLRKRFLEDDASPEKKDLPDEPKTEPKDEPDFDYDYDPPSGPAVLYLD